MLLHVQRWHHWACHDDNFQSEEGPSLTSMKALITTVRLWVSVGGSWSYWLLYGRNISWHWERRGTESFQIRCTIPIQGWLHNSPCWRSPCAINTLHVILLRSSWMFITDWCPSEDMVVKRFTQYWCCTEASKSASYKWSFHGKRGQGTRVRLCK
jgi:hypothetical protein